MIVMMMMKTIYNIYPSESSVVNTSDDLTFDTYFNSNDDHHSLVGPK